MLEKLKFGDLNVFTSMGAHALSKVGDVFVCIESVYSDLVVIW